MSSLKIRILEQSRQQKNFNCKGKKMKKELVSAFVALSFMACATASFACCGTVKAVDGNTVTVTCDDGTEVTAEGTAKVDDKVCVKDGKVAPAKKKKAIEGC